MRWRSLALKISAWVALLYGLGLAALFGLQVAQWRLGFGAYPALVMCLLLLLGAALTLRRAPHGRVLLATGWGCLFGSFAQTYFNSALMRAIDPRWGERSYSVDPGVILGALLVAIPALSVIGIIASALGELDPPNA